MRYLFVSLLALQLFAVNTLKADSYKGWSYLANLLIQDGFKESEIKELFSDSRIPNFSNIPFHPSPKETSSLYKNFLTEKTIQEGRRCLSNYAKEFSSAESRFGVGKEILAAIVLVETRCGEFLGVDLILERLARVSSVRDFKNLEWNIKRLSKEMPEVSSGIIKARSVYLERTFYPELRALVELWKDGMDIFSLKGSSAGAFGVSQFLPSTYIRFGVDGDHDGIVNLYTHADAIASAANYISKMGWKNSLSEAEKRKILWHYNRSEAYIDTVLSVSKSLR